MQQFWEVEECRQCEQLEKYIDRLEQKIEKLKAEKARLEAELAGFIYGGP